MDQTVRPDTVIKMSFRSIQHSVHIFYVNFVQFQSDDNNKQHVCSNHRIAVVQFVVVENRKKNVAQC